MASVRVLPGSVFDSLTPEDLHLLMKGSPVVDVEVLKNIITHGRVT